MIVLLAIALPAAGGFLAFLQVIRSPDLGEPGLSVPVALAASPDGRHLYVVGRDDNALVVFARDDVTGELTFVESLVDGTGGVFGLLGPSSVAVSPDGRHVYVTADVDDTLAVFARDPTLDELTFIPAALEEDGVGGANGLDGASNVVVTPDDDLVLVSGFDDDALAVFRRDATTDSLTFVEAELGIDGASAVAVSPDSSFAYVAEGLDTAIAVYARDATNDDFSFVETVSGTALANITDLEAPSDGLSLYATAYDDDAVTAFTRAIDGTLTLLATYQNGLDDVTGLDGASSIIVRQQLDLAFVAGQLDGAIAVFNRDPSDGTLYFAQKITGVAGVMPTIDGPSAVVASPDGKFLYIAAEFDNSIVVFRIDAYDFGDAPSPYPTTLVDDGARHDLVSGAPSLGSAPDADPDGQPNADATGDDTAAVSDEDGVVFLDPLEPGASVDVVVSVTAAARLDAWIDFNADGSWSEAGDQIFDNVALAIGHQVLSFTVPLTATPHVETVARFRVSTAGDLDPTGSADDGEVEDHAIVTVPVELQSFGIE